MPELTDEARLAAFRATAESIRDGIQDNRAPSEAAQRHTDQSFVWQIGLMGAGLAALPAIAEHTCQKDISIFLFGAVPIWVAGILYAVIGRIVSRSFQVEDVILSIERSAQSRLFFFDPASRRKNSGGAC
jgi:hypothetical protein